MTQREPSRRIAAILMTLAGFAAAMQTRAAHAGLLYELDNGSRGSGTTALSETGMQLHGAFGSPAASVGPVRFFQGETGEAQANGMFDIAYKNTPGGGNETISDVYPNRVPAVGSVQPHGDGFSFDGTAIWMTTARYNPGGAPAVGTNGVSGTSPVAAPGTGVDIRRPDAGLTTQAITTGVSSTVKYSIFADVYVPAHQADADQPIGTRAVQNAMHIGVYMDREGFGLYAPGGQGLPLITMTPDVWHAAMVLLSVTTDGGALAGNTDDTVTVVRDVYLDGILRSTNTTVFGAGSQVRLRNGPVRFSPGFGLQRGNQGSSSDAFIDNIQAFIPEPASAALLTLGLASLCRRGRKG